MPTAAQFEMDDDSIQLAELPKTFFRAVLCVWPNGWSAKPLAAQGYKSELAKASERLRRKSAGANSLPLRFHKVRGHSGEF